LRALEGRERLREIELEEIADYIARDKPRRALSFIGEIRERCHNLVTFPNLVLPSPALTLPGESPTMGARPQLPQHPNLLREG
jgi:plasmid stabilization system protein ParE